MKTKTAPLVLAVLLLAASLAPGSAKSASPKTPASESAVNAQLIEMGRTINKSGARPEMLEQVQAIIKQHPNNAKAHQLAGNILELLGYTDLADDQYKEADRLDPSRPEAIMDLFNSYVQKGDWQNALTNLFYMERRFPQDPLVAFISAVYFEKQGNLKAAEYQLQKVEASAQKPVGTDGLLAAMRFQQGRFAEALRLCERELSAHPDETRANLVAGQALFALNKQNEATPYLVKACELQPLDKQVNDVCSKLLSDNGRYKESLVPALVYMSQCTDHKELDKAKWRALGIMNKLARNDVQFGIDEASKRVSNTLFEARLHFSAGHVLDKTPYRAMAITEYQKGLALDPTVDKAYYRLARDYECEFQYSKALDMYQKAIEKDPLNQDYNAAFARLAMRVKHKDDDPAMALKQLLRGSVPHS